MIPLERMRDPATGELYTQAEIKVLKFKIKNNFNSINN